ncbi:MAG: hypothetical protein ABMA00_02870 [Gemmatimonas sp.]
MASGRRATNAGVTLATRLLFAFVVATACVRAGPSVVHRDSSTPPAPADAAQQPLTRLPRDAARFEIEVVDDTTVRFKPREALWVQTGMSAYAVDPMSRDAFVARLHIVSVWNETAVAVITSQVTRVTTRHVVLMTPPVVPWWTTRRFWLGVLLGAIVGGVAGAVATP